MARKKVVLIGGTSHVGKSTLARRYAESFGWQNLSTDQFARHPGRPWRDDDSLLPNDVCVHFSQLTTAEMLASVLKHYRSNVMPIAKAVVESHLNNPFDPALVLEGSALLPSEVSSLNAGRVSAIWLTLPDERLRTRIYDNSRFHQRSDADQILIERFTERTIAYSNWLNRAIVAEGFVPVDVSVADPMAVLRPLVQGRL